MDFTLTEEQRMLKDTVARFVEKEVTPHAAEWDEEETLPLEIFKTMGELGLFGISIPEDYGGSESDFLSCLLVMEELGKGDGGLATTWGAHTVLCTESLYRNGTDEQRRRYLPGLIDGSKIGALAITEPEAGSDAMSMRTRAEKQGDHWVLNGTKTFNTNGPVADVAIVYAKTDPEAGAKGITTFLVEDGFPGFTKGKKLKKMGARSSPTGELIFENCLVPEENVLGEINQGVKILMSGLDRERIVFSISTIGGAQAAFNLAYRYAQERVKFGVPIISFQAMQEILAEIATDIQAARLLAYWAATRADRGEKVSLDASYAKLFCSQTAVRVVNKAMEIFGGYGFMREYPIQRYFRDTKGLEFGAGTSQIQRMIILKNLLSGSDPFPL
ncbi:MAG: acyl-CoA dehydrogenase family protein [Deltaproteobacteria bacterium]|nr:acyl-CoA dehydrogenase family protein [Deltaproteobacteria bacterium]